MIQSKSTIGVKVYFSPKPKERRKNDNALQEKCQKNKLFRDHFAEKLSNAELLDVWHVGKSYGGTPLYTPERV